MIARFPLDFMILLIKTSCERSHVDVDDTWTIAAIFYSKRSGQAGALTDLSIELAARTNAQTALYMSYFVGFSAIEVKGFHFVFKFSIFPNFLQAKNLIVSQTPSRILHIWPVECWSSYKQTVHGPLYINESLFSSVIISLHKVPIIENSSSKLVSFVTSLRFYCQAILLY